MRNLSLAIFGLQHDGVCALMDCELYIKCLTENLITLTWSDYCREATVALIKIVVSSLEIASIPPTLVMNKK